MRTLEQEAAPEAHAGGNVAAHARGAELGRGVRRALRLRAARPQAEADQQAARDGQAGQAHAEQRPARIEAEPETHRPDGQVEQAPHAVGRPGVAAQAAQSQGQASHQRHVRNDLPRLQYEERQRAQRQGREHRGPPAEESQPGPVDREDGENGEKTVAGAAAELADPKDLHAQRADDEIEGRLGREALVHRHVGERALGHVARVLGDLELPGIPEAEGADAGQNQQHREEGDPPDGRYAAQFLDETHSCSRAGPAL